MMRINGRDICPCELLRVSLRSVIVIFLVALSNSCGGSKGNILLTEVREIPVDGEMPLLEGKELDLEILGAKKLSVCGDWMIVNTSNKNAQVSLVNLNTLEEIAGICPEGKAKTDFRYPDFSIRQFVMEDDGHWKMIMKDNWSTIKYIDLTESAAQKRTVIDRYFEEGKIHITCLIIRLCILTVSGVLSSMVLIMMTGKNVMSLRSSIVWMIL